ASICRALRLSVFSMSSTNVNTSPERSQPKQYQDCICGLTLKLGLSSWWNGQSPHRSRLRLVRRTCSCTIFIRSTLALTSAKASSDVAMDIDDCCDRLWRLEQSPGSRRIPSGPSLPTSWSYLGA